ncbi:SIT4 phosphatase-associated protein-domain-containing protein [Dipodascopsis tothii]|uniref:SIT4 phosphatase-associated protein-domain-containing protein n=1 Tax=Dipodascopsis tothii TaxID=44089 RepID=UPI0034CD57D8
MAFWRVGTNFASLNTISGVNKLLDKPDCTLAELLEEEDLMQELREHNGKLIEFLREPRILQQLLRYISHWTPPPAPATPATDTDADDAADGKQKKRKLKAEAESEPAAETESEDPEFADDAEYDDLDRQDEDLGLTRVPASPEANSSSFYDDEKAWRYARTSADVFSSEIWSIYETVIKETALLDEFWMFLDKPAPLDPVFAGYFTRANEQFLDRKTDEMVDFIKTQRNVVQRFMRHIDTPSIMDLLLKILCTDKPDSPTGVIEMLSADGLIDALVSFLDKKHASITQTAAGDFLKALITISANASNDFTSLGPNELTRELVSPRIMTKMVNQMIESGGSALSTAVGVIIEIIRKNNSDYDAEPMMCTTLQTHPPTPRDPIYLGHLLKILSQNIPRFQALLTKTHTERMGTSFGVIEPLGFERFKICELVAELLHCSNMALLNDPLAEGVAAERDAERRRLIKHYQSLSGRNSLENDDKYSVDELGRSVHDFSMDEEPQMLNDHDMNEQNRGWWGLGKKKSERSTPVSSPEPKSPLAEHSKDAEAEEIEDTKAVEPTAPVDAAADADAPVPEAADDSAVATETGDETTLDAAAGVIDTEVLTVEDLPSVDDSRLVIGDYLKSQLIRNNVVSTILDLFFRFPWNNFLHNVVFDIIQQIYNGLMSKGYNRFLAIELFRTDNITEKIVAGTEANEEHEARTRMRLGYMGHLTLISEEIVKFLNRFPPESMHPGVAEKTVKSAAWNHYVDETLVQIRMQDNSILGGQRPNSEIPESHMMITMDEIGQGDDIDVDEDDDDDESAEVAAEYGHEDNLGIDRDDEAAASAMMGHGHASDHWSRYMSQQMTKDIPDRFGSSDEDDEEDDEDVVRERVGN